jgi:rifampicin phosphotransferase
MSIGTDAGPRPIPVPEHFPFEWDDPADAHGFWEREVMHFPTQVTVLNEDLLQRMVVGSFNAACEHYDMPIRNSYRRVNTWMYQGIAPVSHDPGVMQEIGKRAGENLGRAIGTQIERWHGESLPELERMYEVWDGFDLDGVTDERFLTHLDRTVELFVRAWEIHFQTVFPVMVGGSLFHDLHDELLGEEDGFDAYRLLQGLDNKSLEADRALHRLSRTAQRNPAVLAVLAREAAADVPGTLAQTPGTEEFRAELEAYLEEYGKRLRLYLTLSEPSYIEDPSPLITALKDAVTRPDSDPDAELAGAARERELLIAAARERLSGLPESVVEQFDYLLDGAQQSAVIQENHNFAIDCRVNYEVRRVLLAAGRRLHAAGTIDDPNDVFNVRLAELRDALAGNADPSLPERVAERRAELDRWREQPYPPALGTLPPGPPPDDPIGRAVGRFFGTPPLASAEATLIYGLKGSPGTARGRARVIRSLADAHRLGAGEVLVTETTAPPWTPLFARAAAIVTDAGGILSHCAVVAREYGVPAVVGTRTGTRAIEDGRLVEVDGTAGTVRMLDE